MTEMVGKSTCGSGETGKEPERDDAGQRDRDGEQCSRHRPVDEWLRDVHRLQSAGTASGLSFLFGREDLNRRAKRSNHREITGVV